MDALRNIHTFFAYYNTLSPEEQQSMYNSKPSTIKQYEHCFVCGNSYKDFSPAKEGDSPIGCTLNAIIQPEETPMEISQEPKYDFLEGRVVNRATQVPIPDDEPLVIFRAKDIHSVQALGVYMEICQNAAHKRVIQKRIEDFKSYQDEHPELVREPD